MTPNERGSASLFGAVVLMPLFFVLLTVGVETSRYFGARELLLAHLDTEMATSLRLNDTEERAEERLRERVTDLGYQLADLSVGIKRQGSVLEGVVRGTYQAPLGSLAAWLTGGTPEGIPLVVYSRIRRPRASALIVLDRSIEAGANPCDSDGLRARTQAVSRLGKRLRDEGMARIEIAVFPGTAQELDILYEGDDLPRCPATDFSLGRVESVQGVSYRYLSEPLTFAHQIARQLLNASEVNVVERRTLIMVASNHSSNVDLFSNTAALVERDAGTQGSSVRSVGILVDQSPDEVSNVAVGSRGRSSLLRISDEELRSSSFEVALLRHVQGHTVVAR
jgi:hypothetical protein